MNRRILLSLALTGGVIVALAGFTGDTRQRSSGTSTTTWSVNGCTFTVTYAWSGFNGRNLIASFGMYERMGTWDASFNLANIEGQVGKSGSVTHTFTLAANAKAARPILARGALVNGKTYAQIEGTTSGTSSIVSTCG